MCVNWERMHQSTVVNGFHLVASVVFKGTLIKYMLYVRKKYAY